MARVGDEVVLGAGDPPGEHGRHLAEAGHVVLADRDQGRPGHLLQHVDGLRVGRAVGVLAEPVLTRVAGHHAGQLTGQVRALARGGEQRMRQPGRPAGQHPAHLDLPGDLLQGVR